jgi:isopenicillin-N N-acyltransferase-like protein
MSGAFPLVEIEGDPESRGRQYGRQAGDQLAASVAIYRDGFERSGTNWTEAVGLAQAFLHRISAMDEQFVLEMKGIARGGDQPLEHVVIINARTELLFWKNERPAAALPAEECTTALALPETTSNQHLLHGQNWDWNPRCEDSGIVLKIHNEDAPDILTFVEAGQLARSGMNSAGIALTATGLHGDQDYGRLGVPSPFIRRKLLSQDRLAPALSAILRAEISFSHFILVSHEGGEAVGLETTPDEAFWMQPDDGLLWHANHFKIPAALARVRDVGLRRTPESLYRDSRVGSILKSNRGQICVNTFKRAFADDYGTPDAVLRQPAARPGGNLSATVASLIMDSTAKTMWIARAPYRDPLYVEYTL